MRFLLLIFTVLCTHRALLKRNLGECYRLISLYTQLSLPPGVLVSAEADGEVTPGPQKRREGEERGSLGGRPLRRLWERRVSIERPPAWSVCMSISTSICGAMSQTRDIQGREGGVGRNLRQEQGDEQTWEGGVVSWPRKAELGWMVLGYMWG